MVNPSDGRVGRCRFVKNFAAAVEFELARPSFRRTQAPGRVPMANFMLFLHERTTANPNLSRDEMTRIINEYSGWATKMRQEGRFVASDKLTDDPGKVLRPSGGKTVTTDGPYAETKEIVSGYFCIKAANYDEAVSIAQTCPHLKYGGTIEVRMVHEL
jgi:hypothetical protein